MLDSTLSGTVLLPAVLCRASTGLEWCLPRQVAGWWQQQQQRWGYSTAKSFCADRSTFKGRCTSPNKVHNLPQTVHRSLGPDPALLMQLSEGWRGAAAAPHCATHHPTPRPRQAPLSPPCSSPRPALPAAGKALLGDERVQPHGTFRFQETVQKPCEFPPLASRHCSTFLPFALPRR